jgi:hypothetical protein
LGWTESRNIQILRRYTDGDAALIPSKPHVFRLPALSSG